MNDYRMVENVMYARYLVRWTTADGKRHRAIRWSPAGAAWVRGEVARELVDRFTLEGIKPSSVTVERKASK